MNRLRKTLLVLAGVVTATLLLIPGAVMVLYEELISEPYTAFRHADIIKEIEKKLSLHRSFKKLTSEKKEMVRKKAIDIIRQNYKIPWYISLLSRYSGLAKNTLTSREIIRVYSSIPDDVFREYWLITVTSQHSEYRKYDFPQLKIHLDKIKTVPPVAKEYYPLSRLLDKVGIDSINQITPANYTKITTEIKNFLDGLIAKLQQVPETHKEEWENGVTPYIQKFKETKNSIKNLDAIQMITSPELWYRDRVEKRVLRYFGFSYYGPYYDN